MLGEVAQYGDDWTIWYLKEYMERLRNEFPEVQSYETTRFEEAIVRFVEQYNLLFVHPFKRNTSRRAA